MHVRENKENQSMGTMEGKSATTRESVMEERIGKILTVRFGRGLKDCTKEEIFEALMQNS